MSGSSNINVPPNSGGATPTAPYPPIIMSNRFPSTLISSVRSSSLNNGRNYASNSTPPAAAAPTTTASIGQGSDSLFRTTSSNFFYLSTAAAATDGDGSHGPDNRGRGINEDESGPTKLVDLPNSNQQRGRSVLTSSSTTTTPRVQFCQWDTLACINCRENTVATTNVATIESILWSDQNDCDDNPDHTVSPATPVRANTSNSRKAGPLLLDLRRLECTSPKIDYDDERNNNNNNDTYSSLIRTTTICQSRGNPSFGASISSTCLDVYRNSFIHTADSNSTSNLPTCVTGLSTGGLCVHSFSNEDNYPDDEIQTSIEYLTVPRIHRPATAVVWRPSSNQVAIGLTAAGTERQTSQSTFGRGNVAGQVSGPNRNPGDRDYCCFVWDIEHQSSGLVGVAQSMTASSTSINRRTKSTPLSKLSHLTGVSSLGWVLENGQTLVIGGQQRNLQLYDLRSDSHHAPASPVAVYAHTDGVHGIEVDPLRPWHLATFSKKPGEVVKLWDARRIDSPVTEIKIAATPLGNSKTLDKTTSSSSDSLMTLSHLSSSSQTISAIKWSMIESGHLSVLVGDSMVVYDTSTSGSRPIHVSTINHKKPIVDFTHYPYHNLENSLPESWHSTRLTRKVLEELFSKRLIVVHDDQSLCDFPAHRIAPLAVSPRTGQVVHALGRTLLLDASPDGPTTIERPFLNIDEDISATMMRRARCSHFANYSINTALNIDILTNEATTLMNTQTLSEREQLIRLWKWIQRVEALCEESSDEYTNPPEEWVVKGLMDAGALQLLEANADKRETKNYSDSLCCATYDSDSRRAALTSCGWAGRFDLKKVMEECEVNAEYEHSAALAVWHGDIGVAVDALQRGSAFIRKQLSKETRTTFPPQYSSKYPETLDLVSLSIAGYRGGETESGAYNVWRKACSNLLERSELSDTFGTGSRVGYLRHILKFLIAIGIDNTHKDVLNDTSLSLCDRVAFACRFLTRADLKAFLDNSISECEKTGNIEGLTITGIEKRGISILQGYVDRLSDVQTAALITSRVIFPADWTMERKIAAEWLQSYRSLLNRWQMWQSRATFDCDRADLLRRFKMRQNEGSIGNSKHGVTRRLPPGRRPGMRPSDPDVQASVAAQLDARCNYCSAPLGLRKQENHPNQWLSKMKNVLSCCPQCRKPLPKCAICMLSLGCLNPYTELAKRGAGGAPSQLSDDLSSLANLPFAEWFTWCIRCKHGGHAQHLVAWFSKHEVCPVSGCDCLCQFDGICKLRRPSLQLSNHLSFHEPKNPSTGFTDAHDEPTERS